jgi:glycerophosphoryl diester phosphodiesterase
VRASSFQAPRSISFEGSPVRDGDSEGNVGTLLEHMAGDEGRPTDDQGELMAVLDTVAVQAHRGSPETEAGIGENTLAAFLRARRLGADGIELDVRLTADGALVVHHDASIPGVGAIVELGARDLPDHVPLLTTVVETLSEGGGMTINIEIKNLPTEPGYDPDETAAGLVAELVDRNALVDSIVVSSFWPASLDAAVGALPSLSTGLLLASWADAHDGLARARDHGYTAVHPHASLVTTSLVEQAHRWGLSVATWTVNDRPTFSAVFGCGVDTVITDDVGLITSIVCEGQPD